jgi:hypothetical protein
MNRVIKELRAFRRRLQDDAELPSAERKEAISEVDAAIGCLKLCERFDIFGNAEVITLPAQGTSTLISEYRIVEDHETEDRTIWTEITVDGEKVRAHAGDLILRR